jgi:hypothetical protein
LGRVAGPGGSALGRHGQRPDDFLAKGATAVVMPDAGTLIVEPEAQPIGRPGDGGMPLGPRVDFQMRAGVAQNHDIPLSAVLARRVGCGLETVYG